MVAFGVMLCKEIQTCRQYEVELLAEK